MDTLTNLCIRKVMFGKYTCNILPNDLIERINTYRQHYISYINSKIVFKPACHMCDNDRFGVRCSICINIVCNNNILSYKWSHIPSTFNTVGPRKSICDILRMDMDYKMFNYTFYVNKTKLGYYVASWDYKPTGMRRDTIDIIPLHNSDKWVFIYSEYCLKYIQDLHGNYRVLFDKNNSYRNYIYLQNNS